MLQPRASWRSLQRSCRCFSSLFSRAYVTEATEAPRSEDAPVELPSAPPAVQWKGPPKMRRYTPRTPGLRHLVRPLNDHLWKGRPVTKLTFPKKGQAKGGRNVSGRITVRHRGGGHKRRIRTVDFNRWEPGPHVVERIEHDPGRTAHIALVKSERTGRQSYILAADGMRAGEKVESYRSGIPDHLWERMGGSVDPGVLAAQTAWRGNCLPLTMVPVGSLIFNIGLYKGKGGQMCRGAGTYATLLTKPGDPPPDRPSAEESKEEPNKEGNENDQGEQQATESKPQPSIVKESGEPMTEEQWKKLKKLSEHVTIRLSSGEERLIHKDCCATIGVASNSTYRYSQLGKAGRSRWLGIRPTVRGLAMNAMDHPHGGGRGKSKGRVPSKSPWGLPAKGGYKTRPKKKVNNMVVTPRPRKQGKRRRKGYN